MMEDSVQLSVTRLLDEVQKGNRSALDELVPLVYEELRVLAHRQRQRWHGDATMGTTALVHEAYLKLVKQRAFGPHSRAHFFAVAARAMRHILCNYARDRCRQKRGGGVRPLTLDAAAAIPGEGGFSAEQAETLAALDDALRRLEQIDRRQAQIIECRFFGGMTNEDTARALGISVATTKRDWAIARSWLYRALHAREDA